MATQEDLQGAFAGESQANRKYQAFAKKADKDGYPQIARIFRAAAEAETIHAHGHLRVMGGIKSTRENLEKRSKVRPLNSSRCIRATSRRHSKKVIRLPSSHSKTHQLSGRCTPVFISRR